MIGRGFRITDHKESEQQEASCADGMYKKINGPSQHNYLAPEKQTDKSQKEGKTDVQFLYPGYYNCSKRNHEEKDNSITAPLPGRKPCIFCYQDSSHYSEGRRIENMFSVNP